MLEAEAFHSGVYSISTLVLSILSTVWDHLDIHDAYYRRICFNKRPGYRLDQRREPLDDGGAVTIIKEGV